MTAKVETTTVNTREALLVFELAMSTLRSAPDEHLRALLNVARTLGLPGSSLDIVREMQLREGT